MFETLHPESAEEILPHLHAVPTLPAQRALFELAWMQQPSAGYETLTGHTPPVHFRLGVTIGAKPRKLHAGTVHTARYLRDEEYRYKFGDITVDDTADGEPRACVAIPMEHAVDHRKLVAVGLFRFIRDEARLSDEDRELRDRIIREHQEGYLRLPCAMPDVTIRLRAE